jgi:hypothetical protein
MAGQLARLAEVSELPNVSLRVAPGCTQGSGCTQG